MSDAKRNQQALKALREERGAALEPVQALLKDQVKIVNELTRQLKDRPKTVPELAEITHLPTQTVFWHLIALKKYGKVVEAERDGDYFRYGLTNE